MRLRKRWHHHRQRPGSRSEVLDVVKSLHEDYHQSCPRRSGQQQNPGDKQSLLDAIFLHLRALYYDTHYCAESWDEAFAIAVRGRKGCVRIADGAGTARRDCTISFALASGDRQKLEETSKSNAIQSSSCLPDEDRTCLSRVTMSTDNDDSVARRCRCRDNSNVLGDGYRFATRASGSWSILSSEAPARQSDVWLRWLQLSEAGGTSPDAALNMNQNCAKEPILLSNWTSVASTLLVESTSSDLV